MVKTEEPGRIIFFRINSTQNEVNQRQSKEHFIFQLIDRLDSRVVYLKEIIPNNVTYHR